MGFAITSGPVKRLRHRWKMMWRGCVRRTRVFPDGLSRPWRSSRSQEVSAMLGTPLNSVESGERHHEGDSIEYAGMEDTVLRFEVDAGGAVFYSQAFYID